MKRIALKKSGRGGRRKGRPPPVDTYDGLTSRQSLAASMIAGGCSLGEVSEELSVSKATICDWKKLPAFQKKIGVILDDLSDSARHRAQVLIPKALATLEEAIETGGKKGSRFTGLAAVRSAQTIIAIYVRDNRGAGEPAHGYTPDESFM